jgi:hypothetical protein
MEKFENSSLRQILNKEFPTGKEVRVEGIARGLYVQPVEGNFIPRYNTFF